MSELAWPMVALVAVLCAAVLGWRWMLSGAQAKRLGARLDKLLAGAEATAAAVLALERVEAQRDKAIVTLTERVQRLEMGKAFARVG